MTYVVIRLYLAVRVHHTLRTSNQYHTSVKGRRNKKSNKLQHMKAISGFENCTISSQRYVNGMYLCIGSKLISLWRHLMAHFEQLPSDIT